MEPDGDAQAGEHVEDREHDQVARSQQPFPRPPCRDAKGEHRHDRDQARDYAVAQLVLDRLHVAGIRHRYWDSHEPSLSALSGAVTRQESGEAWRARPRVGATTPTLARGFATPSATTPTAPASRRLCAGRVLEAAPPC